MGILKEASDSLLKFSEIIVDKTNDYARMAKLNIDIKKLELEITRAQTEIGKYALGKKESGAASLDLADETMTGYFGKIKNCQSEIEIKKVEIQNIKNKEQKKDTV